MQKENVKNNKLMRKSQVPRGATRKELCRCGKFYFWNYCDGNSTSPRGACSYCKLSVEKKK